MHKMLKIIHIFCVFLIAHAGADSNEVVRKKEFAVEGPCLDKNESHFARNSRGCAWYFLCDENGEVLREDRCGDDLWFDEENQKCNWREELECDYDDRWIDLICPNVEDISLIPHPYTCSKYTVCFEGIQNDRDCPEGLHFSTYDRKCVDPFLADCNLDKTLCGDVGNQPKFIPSTRDCRAYYMCIGSFLIPLTCAPGQHFLPEAGWCDLEDLSDCKPLIPENTPEIPTKDSIDCNGSSGLEVPHPDSCEFFFFCAGDRSYLRLCGEGLIFDINTRRCQLNGNPGVLCILDANFETTEAPENELSPY